LAAASGRCRNAQLPSVEMGPPAPVRDVERFGQSLPEGPYGRRNRQAIAARETRVTTRLVAAALSRPGGMETRVSPSSRDGVSRG
jgi:hypothetical protein